MLDVDGHVISAAELVARVEQLLRSIDTADISESTRAGKGSATPPPVSPEDLVLALRDAQTQIQPPELGQGGGLRGQSAAFVKRVVRKLTSWYVEPRWVAQQVYNGYNIDITAGSSQDVRRLDNEFDELRRQITMLKLQLITTLERVRQRRNQLERVSAEGVERQAQFIAAAEEYLRAAATHDDFRPARSDVAGKLERMRAASASGAAIDYVAFEDRFRGSGAQIQDAQKRYLSLFPPAGIPGRVVDIGCGRGEMLELFRDAGHEVLGVDLDPGMVEVCVAKGLPAVKDDGIHILERTDDNSLKGIFCAQVVEHLLTSELERFIRLAHQTLVVGGVLVVETINPRSLFALGNHFFADTTHVRPVHPETLRFMCEQVGFSLVQLEERSPHAMLDLADDLPDGKVGTAVGALLQSVFGYQDYAIAATK